MGSVASGSNGRDYWSGECGVGRVADFDRECRGHSRKAGVSAAREIRLQPQRAAEEIAWFDRQYCAVTDWREVVSDPEIDIVVELIGGTATAGQILEESLKQRKSVVTANKELMALRGAELWDKPAERREPGHGSERGRRNSHSHDFAGRYCGR